MPEVDIIALVAPVINEELLLLDPTPEDVTMNDAEVIWTRIKSPTKCGPDLLTNYLRIAYTVSKNRTYATD